jgi:hypothetical protein
MYNKIINRGKMIKREEKPVYSESRWQIVAQFSLRGKLGCEHEASEKVAEILVSVHIPDRVLVDAKQAVAKVMEKEMSRIVADQAQWAFTIIVQTQLAPSIEAPANEADNREPSSGYSGWGFFLTENRAPETELGNKMNHVQISVHLYKEGRSE